MDIPMVNVSARIIDQRGRPVQRARITMRLTTVERFCGLVVPREVEAFTDQNGLATLRVWPNELGSEGSEYQVTISFADACQSRCPNHPSGNIAPIQNQRFRCVVPNADCNLQDIAELPPYEQRGSGQVITAEVAAFASQASGAADRAQNTYEAVDAIRVTLEGLADDAASAKVAAQDAAKQAGAHEKRSQELVDGVDDKICHFENTVTARTEKTAQRMVQEARQCVKQAETIALDAIEQRTGDSLSEIGSMSAAAQKTGVDAIVGARDAALTDVTGAKEKALSEIAEEVALAREDFDSITERALSAAKRAGCSAASAANASTKACECAERAERAANSVERFSGEALSAAERAVSSAACANADAQRAETAANSALGHASNARAATDTAIRHAQLSSTNAQASYESADSARDAASSAQANREHVDEVVRDIDGAIADAAAGIISDDIVDAATAKATEEATAASTAADASASAASESEAAAKADAEKAEGAAKEAAEAAASAAEHASKLKDEYDAQVAVASMAQEVISLSDRLTQSQLAGIEACLALAKLQDTVIRMSDSLTDARLGAMPI